MLGNGFWIEVFHAARAALPTAQNRVINNVLAKPGQILGCSAMMDSAEFNTAALQGVGITCAEFSPTADAELTMGKRVTGIRHRISNGSGVTLTVGLSAIYLLRGSAR